MDHMEDDFITDEYAENVVSHFLDPQNVGVVEHPDAWVRVGDPECGDYIELSLRVADNRIAEIRYLVFGCIGAISTSSALSVMVRGRTLEEALRVTDDDVIEYLGGIPEHKKHCSLLGVRGLLAAVEQIRAREPGGAAPEPAGTP